MTATGSPVLSVQDRLSQVVLIDPNVLSYFRATKTANIRAKPMAVLLADKTMIAKLLLDTLEGTQTLKAGSMVCTGVSGDYWQQTKDKLLQKYTVIDIDAEGWLICQPKPDNEVDAAEIQCGNNFAVFGQWGEEAVIDNRKVYIQWGKSGDFICRRLDDPTDVWIVKRGLFLSTYQQKA